MSLESLQTPSEVEGLLKVHGGIQSVQFFVQIV